MGLTCTNPNGYDIRVRASTKDHSTAYVGKDRTAVTSVLELPSTVLHREGTGYLNASVTITASQQEIIALAPTFLGAEPVPFEMTLTMDVNVNVNFFLQKWKMSQAFVKDCGIAMQGIAQLALGQPGGKMSTLVCADSFEDLAIPSVSELAPISEGIRLSAKQIQPADVAQGTFAKNLGLGAIMALCYSASVAMAAGALCCLLGCCCCGPALGAARVPGLAKPDPTADVCPSETSLPSESSRSTWAAPTAV